MPNCTICRHPERNAIDRGIVAGKSQRDLAKIFSVSRDCILRHSRHLAEIVAQSNEATVITHADDLVGLIRRASSSTRR